MDSIHIDMDSINCQEHATSRDNEDEYSKQDKKASNENSIPENYHYIEQNPSFNSSNKEQDS